MEKKCNVCLKCFGTHLVNNKLLTIVGQGQISECLCGVHVLDVVLIY